MKAALVLASLLYFFVTAIGAEDASYFENTYGVKLHGLKPIADYDDPDAFYTEIAKQVGIPDLAFREVTKKEGWARDESHVLKCIVRRSEGSWLVLVIRMQRALNQSLMPQVLSSDSFR